MAFLSYKKKWLFSDKMKVLVFLTSDVSTIEINNLSVCACTSLYLYLQLIINTILARIRLLYKTITKHLVKKKYNKTFHVRK